MGQGIKGMIGTKVKIVIILMLALMAFSIFFLTNPTDNHVTGILNENVSKLEKDNHYYFSLKQYDNKQIKLECTKEQYNSLVSRNEYDIFYRLNFFNRKEGKILRINCIPIDCCDLTY